VFTIVLSKGRDGIVDFHDFFVESYWKIARIRFSGSGKEVSAYVMTKVDVPSQVASKIVAVRWSRRLKGSDLGIWQPRF